MANIFEIRKRLEIFIELLALNKVDRFYPSALAKHLGISSGEAFNYLLERTGARDQLILKWELRCPYCHRTLTITDEIVLDEGFDCNCGEEVEFKSSDFFPVFQINPVYKDFLKEEIKKKSNLSLRRLQMA